MAQTWYIDANGRVEGPLTDSELRVRVADGLLQPADSVSVDGVKWVAANAVPELSFPPSTDRGTGLPKPAAKPRRPLVETVVTGSNNVHDSSALAPPFSPLDSIPGYDVQGTLGTGACGVVFRAVQKKLNRVVALKTVKMARNTPADVVARFEQEAVSLARLQHPNIVSVYDCGHSHGRAFFAMELLDGEDLDARLDRAGPLDEHTAWLIARQTAAALDHAANLGVIHRDIKPANLFLVSPPTGFPLPAGVPMVKVTDFGLALTRAEQTDQKQTAAGVILGTPVYMAPEQFAGSDVDPRADIYSLGATVYHTLTGEVPFDGRTVWDVMMKKSVTPPRLQPPISEETAGLVAAMMATDPGDRPTDYAALIARIDALPCLDGAFSSARLPVVSVLSRLPPTPAPAPPPPKRKRWVYAVATAALLGVAVGVASLAGAFNRPQGKTDPAANAKPATYARGKDNDLFSNSVLRWAGQGWSVEQDEEKKNVLTGKGTVTRKLSSYPNFRVFLAIAPHEATTLDVVLATTGGAPTSATRWIVRLDPKAGAAFGKCVGTGAFEPLGAAVPIQFIKENQSPYLELRYERVGGVLSAWFDNQPLGSTPDTDLRTTELRIEIKGGPVRIESAHEVELTEQK